MKNILEELYNGNVRPNERANPKSAEYKALAAEVLSLEAEFLGYLGREDQELYERLAAATSALYGSSCAEDFTFAFRLGAQIMLEVLL